MNRISLSLSAALLAGALAAAPQVSDVSVAQEATTHAVTVGYTLSGDARAIVTLDVLTNGVSVGGAALAHVAGDANCIVASGSRRLVWCPDETFPNRAFADGSMTFAVQAWALDDPPPYFVASLVAQSNGLFYASAEAIPDGVADERYKTDFLVMRRIPAKDVVWRMGTSASVSSGDEWPHHRVKLDHDYYMGIYEFTQRQWVNFYGSNVSGDTTNALARLRPVETLSKWNAVYNLRGDVVATDCAANTHENFNVSGGAMLQKLRDLTGVAFDLPTEAEWEFAARAGSGDAWPSGETSDDLGDFAWHKANAVNELGVLGSHPVGLKSPNAWGLYDVCGNVSEAVIDWWTDGGSVSVSEDEVLVNPVGNARDGGKGRCNKGGSYSSDAKGCRFGSHGSSNNGSEQIGFRAWCPADFASSGL